MPDIPPQKLALVKGLVKTMPVGALRTLDKALALSRDAKMRQVREILLIELEARHARDVVFAPYLPLFQAREDGLDAEVFPKWLLDNLWRQLRSEEPQLCGDAVVAIRSLRDDDPAPVVFFRLVTAGARILREAPLAVAPKGHDEADLREVTEFAHYLDLHRLLRQFLARLPDWMGRIDAEKAATLRLWYKDACAFSEDAGVRFIEAIFANLDDGAMIIKIIATVADRPNDRFLAESELADFGERILLLAEQRTDTLKRLLNQTSKDLSFMAEAGGDIGHCLNALSGLEHYIELARDGPWGKRVAAIHKVIAELAEDRLKAAANIMTEALPMTAEKVAGRVRKDYPDIRTPMDDLATRNAQAMLKFVWDIKYSSGAGGYAALHGRTVQALEGALDTYMDDLIEIANHGAGGDAEALMTRFEGVIDLIEALSGEDRASLARRRVASSDILNPSKSLA
ncbi:hypothetical protein OVA03_14580 [Asticcacaulis sp. SL142]|uniref:hypothetical protein n=1 Tax=Asticcacaulis sp. SL142 TaxID=2995155 RepID=UPI00226C76E3|nr:hypothetical protein [Asticcacaulis sp. SL142]WAC47913.1 hypothetical protein OVA03_14580 [Asticcacaulis sp. SL142]